MKHNFGVGPLSPDCISSEQCCESDEGTTLPFWGIYLMAAFCPLLRCESTKNIFRSSKLTYIDISQLLGKEA